MISKFDCVMHATVSFHNRRDWQHLSDMHMEMGINDTLFSLWIFGVIFTPYTNLTINKEILIYTHPYTTTHTHIETNTHVHRNTYMAYEKVIQISTKNIPCKAM